LENGHGYPVAFDSCFGTTLYFYQIDDVLDRIDFEPKILSIDNCYTINITVEEYYPSKLINSFARQSNCFYLNNQLKLSTDETEFCELGQFECLNGALGIVIRNKTSPQLENAAISLLINPSVLATTAVAKLILSLSAVNFNKEKSDQTWNGETYENLVSRN
jgi:hypothetical protein